MKQLAILFLIVSSLVGCANSWECTLQNNSPGNLFGNQSGNPAQTAPASFKGYGSSIEEAKNDAIVTCLDSNPYNRQMCTNTESFCRKQK